jgi:uncharacterized membrane protein
MRAPLKTALIALTALGFTSSVLVTSADAQSRKRHRVYVCTTDKAKTNRGTLIGAGSGALLGSAVAGHGAKTEGAVLGGVVGAVAGHQVAKKKKCHYEYRYY